jgi:hypothetical protein
VIVTVARHNTALRCAGTSLALLAMTMHYANVQEGVLEFQLSKALPLLVYILHFVVNEELISHLWVVIWKKCRKFMEDLLFRNFRGPQRR